MGFLADRLEGGLQRDARQLLGGDAVLVSDHALPSEVTQWVQASGLQSAVTMTFPTMVRAGDGPDASSRLVALKVVASGYPLRGVLQILPPLDTPLPVAALSENLTNQTPYDRPGVPTKTLPKHISALLTHCFSLPN